MVKTPGKIWIYFSSSRNMSATAVVGCSLNTMFLIIPAWLNHDGLKAATVAGIIYLNWEGSENRGNLVGICNLLTCSGEISHIVTYKKVSIDLSML